MSFIVNEDMFGRYCRIPTDTSGNMHIYKIVSRIDSNSYCDVPLMVQSKETLHKQIVPVLLVIHCGIDESEVQRVALSDCEIVPAADVQEVRHGRWILEAHDERVNYRWNVTSECSECCDERKEIWAGFFPNIDPSIARSVALASAKGVKLSNYCPNCGADMRGSNDE